MGLNDQVSAERVHIGFFGIRNAGKSSVVNAVTGQKLSLVSDVKGTTTDPVKKAMEILPVGPVVIIDTPGIDDDGKLGEMRVKRALQALNQTDIAVLVVDGKVGKQEADRELIALFESKKIPYIIVYNKSDLCKELPSPGKNELYVSAVRGENIHELKEMIARFAVREEENRYIVADLLSAGDLVVLVVPIDSAAPKGRLILPQQQTIREILDAGATAVVTREKEFSQTLTALFKKPRLVITDSQVFEQVRHDTPDDILLTSFSILFARYKGNLKEAVCGAAVLDRLQDGDTVLISEGCTHHRQCDDIGTVKLPQWIRAYTGKKIGFDFTSGGEFPEDLSEYALVIHCGGCMLSEKEMRYRVRYSIDHGVPVTNYGIAIAQMHGILQRSIAPFPTEPDIQ
ncbi:[FeFe] hydrogenase H-cluster maturation GTPase HydF [Ruminococcus sp. OA3]|uniref:[FeFe] hydrogenase H-cluster maturation GTPase HydF n=1 Tax=Ruminococcus sp. OA3 TaxID=2914164 RepID=UPI001F055B87|nr:[FeFe] hydrogenase H-cluster maturation GTPase HydF [Ruminococcus sp. OA3]MCH1983256.1 [FeFe] hydrogenase H-cluster maturation GTPase HydF [Ruminococcus sp. OA3]